MLVWEFFKEIFSKENLEKTYFEQVIYSGARGLDGTGHNIFRENLDSEIGIILKKVYKGTYRFTPYKMKLQSKGANKNPRIISIPTIRDRLVLRSLSDYTNLIFGDIAKTPIPHKTIGLTKDKIYEGKYETVIRLDIKEFFDSINHEILLSLLENTIEKREVVSLFEKSIKTPSASPGEKPKSLKGSGVPQGLPISNSLANIFLADIDQQFNKKDIFYARYVDDILVLCNKEDAKSLKKEISKYFNDKRLSIHTPESAPEKSIEGPIKGTEFTFLGYLFGKNNVSVRWESVQKFRESIISIFTAYKKGHNKNIKFLEWRLNIRITGCIFDNKSKGWLFFFSELEDEELLHKIDYFIKITRERFGYEVPTKKLSRALYEAKYRRFTSSYIPNYDKYDIEQKREFLREIIGLKGTRGMPDSEIEEKFGGRISKEINELEEDISPAGS